MDKLFDKNIELSSKDYKKVELTVEVMNRWNKLGLYGNVKDECVKKMLALSYERLAVYLVNEVINPKVSDYIEIIAFPMILKIVSLLKEDIMPEKVVRVCERYCELFNIENVNKIFREKGYARIDFEAEMVSLLADGILCDIIRDNDEYYIGKIEKCKEAKKSYHDVKKVDVDIIEAGDYVGSYYSETLYKVLRVESLYDINTLQPVKIIVVDNNGSERAINNKDIVCLYKKKFYCGTKQTNTEKELTEYVSTCRELKKEKEDKE